MDAAGCAGPGQPAPGCAPWCPDCGARAAVKETVTTTPRDVSPGDRQILLRWRNRRRECQNQDCGRKTFTEPLPAVPPRARLTARLRTRLGQAAGDDLMPAAAAARRYGVGDRTAARAFTAYAGTQLADPDAGQESAEAAGIGEFRRGAPASAAGPDTGEVTQTRSERESRSAIAGMVIPR